MLTILELTQAFEFLVSGIDGNIINTSRPVHWR